MKRSSALMGIAVLLMVVGLIRAEEVADSKHEVKKAPFAVHLELPGILVPVERAAVSIEPREWKDWTIKELASPGQMVKKGDVIIACDVEAVSQAIADMEAEDEMKRLHVNWAKTSRPYEEQLAAMTLEDKERAKKLAEKDLSLFLEEDRDWEKQRSESAVRRSQERLLYEEEELDQLEKMYKADDLTEETEEIILLRQRNSVRIAQEGLKEWERARKRKLQLELPRQQQEMQAAAARRAVEWKQAQSLDQLDQRNRELLAAKQEYDEAKRLRRLADLKADRDAMVIKAPADGVVYYGDFADAGWDTATADKLLKLGGKLPAGVVLMTVVQPRSLEVQGWLTEKDLQYRKSIETGVAIPDGLPGVRGEIRKLEIGAHPARKGSFLARFSVKWGKDADAVVPGLGCKVYVSPVKLEEAITIPSKAVFKDLMDPIQSVVYVATGEEEWEKRPVTVGAEYDGRSWIRDGLKAGETILLKRPDSP